MKSGCTTTRPGLPGATVEQADVTALPFDDETFHGAMCAVSIQYVTRPVWLFREVRRVLRAVLQFLDRTPLRDQPAQRRRTPKPAWSDIGERHRCSFTSSWPSGGRRAGAPADRALTRL